MYSQPVELQELKACYSAREQVDAPISLFYNQENGILSFEERENYIGMKSKKVKLPINASLVPADGELYVVGVGASAGGLEAFKRFLSGIPKDSGMAYVLVQHLKANRESLLAELLQKVTTLPVLEITDDIKMEPNHIYVIPSNKMLIASKGVLKLRPREEKDKLNLVIDLFFTSLAEVYQSRAIGMVLSGLAFDGTQGLKAIKDHGGLTFAQDEISATYPSMPNSAMLAGVVDFIFPPEKIPEKILEITQHIKQHGDDEHQQSQLPEQIFKQIISLLYVRKGNNFTYYKQTTIRRRILRRMALTKRGNPAAYLRYLREHTAEQDLLYQDLLIPVTSFFRDPQSFKRVCKRVFTPLVGYKNETETIRVWVAGCSTGEEVYSLAICLKEVLNDKPLKVQIFGTDISEPAIAKARLGFYSPNEVQGLSAQQLQEFFIKTPQGYQVNRTIREMCIFSLHNFLKDPPFSRMDLISCRNVLIYLEPYLQKKVLAAFHYALNTNGFLWLGKSETTGSAQELFTQLLKSEKLFIRNDVASKRIMEVVTKPTKQDISLDNPPPIKETNRPDFQKTTDEIVLSKYTLPGVVVNESANIVYFRGFTGNYLEMSPGKPTLNVLKLAKKGLAFELRNLLHKAANEKTAVKKENVSFEVNAHTYTVSIEVIPLPNMIDAHYLILFHENDFFTDKALRGGRKKRKSEKIDDKDVRIQSLEQELAQIREDMRSITEEQEASNEELQSTNEELLSGNEELQSLNEELETSKEELQSINEELTIVNQELINLVDQLKEEKNYAQAIVETVHTPLLVLDENLLVKSANSAYYKTFRSYEAETKGRLIYEVGNEEWNNPVLQTLLENVLPEKQKFNDFEVTHTFLTIGERTMLINARELAKESNGGKLILLAIDDITEQKKTKALKEANLALLATNQIHAHSEEIAQFGSYRYHFNSQKLEYSDNLYRLLGCVPQEFLASAENFNKFIHPDDLAYVLNATQEAFHQQRLSRWEYRMIKKDGEMIYVRGTGKIIKDAIGEEWMIGTVQNITEEKNREKGLKESEEKFNQLFELSPFIVTLAEVKTGKFVEVNENYLKTFGFSREEVIGHTALEIGMIEQNERQKILDVVLQHGSIRNIELEVKKKSGEKIPVLASVDKIVLADQQFYLNAMIDITERKKVEEEIKLKNTELENINKELQAFAYVSSHDLQEPLRKIQTFALRILEKEYATLSEKGREQFQRMQNAAQRMQALIEDLLAYSRANTTERKFEYTDLSKLVAEVKADLKEELHNRNATIDAVGLGEIYIIPFQFRQLLHNLISNSLKFSKPEQAPHIVIKCEMIKGENLNNKKLLPQKQYCHLTITDNGIGFQPEMSEKIFELFQRLHDRNEYPGTGIGLAIVKKIVENHNGIITASSELKQGATFDIYIPHDYVPR